eukprot:scaffold298045_cov23-Tisochrysis_lutea.AAC.1
MSGMAQLNQWSNGMVIILFPVTLCLGLRVRCLEIVPACWAAVVSRLGCDLEQVGGEAMETVFSDLVIHQRKKGNWWQCESGPENSSSYCSSFSPYNGISDSSSTK